METWGNLLIDFKEYMIPLDLNSLLAFFQQQGHLAEIQADTNQIYFSIKVESREFPVFSRVFEESGLLQVLVFFPCAIESTSISDMARLLHMFNKELDLPGFGMDEGSGVVFFRWMISTQNQKIPEEFVSACLGTLKTVCSNFTAVVEAVASGSITFDALVEKAKGKK